MTISRSPSRPASFPSLVSAVTLLLGVAACPDPEPVSEPVWTLAATELREAILSISGTSSTDVWAVGADRGQGPLVLHFDGATWSELETHERGNLWWVHAFSGGSVFMAGGQSTILRYEGGAFTRMTTPGLSRHIIFGLWGAAANDIYAVGSLGAANGFVWHYDGATWVPVDLPESLPKDEHGNTPGLFKVWGDGQGTVWIVGGGGVVLRSRGGGGFEQVALDTQATLFTVYGGAGVTTIVGGAAGQSVMFEARDGSDPVPVSIDGVSLLQGVSTGAEGASVVCGASGAILERDGDTWRSVDPGFSVAVQSLHAAWIDPQGGAWFVGGNVLGSGLDKGVILHRGPSSIATFVQPALPPPPSTECPAAAIDPEPDASIARRWNEQILNAIRRDIPRPPVHARNLFHLAVAMWDAWAAYDPVADGYLSDEKGTTADLDAARREALSYAAYRVLAHRYNTPNAVGFAVSQSCFSAFMTQLGYDPTDTDLIGNSPRALGNRIGQAVIDYGLGDGANEQNNYKDTTGWVPNNGALVVDEGGNVLSHPDVWQQLNIVEAETQNGIPVDAGIQGYIGAHWREVAPFAMSRATPDALYHDAGPPPVFGPALVPQLVDLIRKHSKLDPAQSETIDLSPGAYGNNPLGSNAGTGHPTNPVTGQPYAPNVTKLGDFARVLAEFWADGPKSETPPGHWDTIANHIADDPALSRQLFGAGPVLDPLEWDVKVYFALNGATHDAAIAAWELKRTFLGGRPISWVRHMATLGQSSDPSLPSYHPDGLPLVPGLIELITADSSQPGERHEHLERYLGQLAVLSWRGEPGNRTLEVGGVGWMRAADWIPYQRRTFVTPAFPGFVSGHSTFSRAGAEVLAAFTGSPYFPGGMGEFVASTDNYLVFERGPSSDVRLQWGTYYDAADQAGQSRIWGGIHIEADDFGGRTIGSAIGVDSVALATTYFEGTARP